MGSGPIDPKELLKGLDSFLTRDGEVKSVDGIAKIFRWVCALRSLTVEESTCSETGSESSDFRPCWKLGIWSIVPSVFMGWHQGSIETNPWLVFGSCCAYPKCHFPWAFLNACKSSLRLDCPGGGCLCIETGGMLSQVAWVPSILPWVFMTLDSFHNPRHLVD